LTTVNKPRPTTVVLGLICLMYMITYVDRVNLGTAAPAIAKDLGLTLTQRGTALSAFGLSYLFFQVFGGWIGDRAGPRWTLFVCGLIWAVATILIGFATSFTTLIAFRLLLGIGEGATFPVATRAMQSWTPAGRRGFAQGITHAFARFGNAVTPPIVAALIASVTWRGSFIALGCTSVVWVIVWVWYVRDVPATHASISLAELEQLPNRGQPLTVEHPAVPWMALTRRMLPVTTVYFCYGYTLWLFLTWLPSFFLSEYKLDIAHSALFASAVFFAGVGGDFLGGLISDAVLHRTKDLRKARRDLVCVGFLGSFACMLPVLVARDLTAVVLCLGGAFFFAELVIGPMWAIPMDIAPKYSGTAAGLMNTGSALAAVVSPQIFGIVVEMTGNWHLPFAGSLGLLLVGAVLAFTMHPERPFEEPQRIKVAI
jgi:sugar phosphate permease